MNTLLYDFPNQPKLVTCSAASCVSSGRGTHLNNLSHVCPSSIYNQPTVTWADDRSSSIDLPYGSHEDGIPAFLHKHNRRKNILVKQYQYCDAFPMSCRPTEADRLKKFQLLRKLTSDGLSSKMDP